MFHDAIVVESAVSAFNNAALWAPMFLWIGLLMLPLYFMIYSCGAHFIETQTWWPGLRNPKNATFNYSVIVSVLMFGWLILMGGNYGVLRDGISTLPYVMAALLFVLSAQIVRDMRVINPSFPEWTPARIRRHPRATRFAALGGVAVVAGLFGAPGITGFLMQAAAVLCGAMLGRAMNRKTSPILTTTLLMLAVMTVILMQPEFFRFGQLGNLTLVHKGALLTGGALAAATVALRNVNPRGRIHKSAFIKVKWMSRFLAILGAVLFIMTESVPLFLGTVVMMFAMFAISVWHAEKIPAKLDKKMWAALLCLFGLVTIMPAITAVGIVYWVFLGRVAVWRVARFLL